MREAVEPLALGQREGLAQPGFLDRGPGNEVFTLLDGEVQDHCAGFGVDTQENRTGVFVDYPAIAVQYPAMTVRAIALGFAGAVFIPTVGYFADHVAHLNRMAFLTGKS